jgi:hypothetical protein
MTRAADLAKLIAGGGTITVDDNASVLSLVSTDTDANSGPVQVLYRNSSSPADSDLVGEMHFRGRNDNSQDVEYVTISTRMEDVSDGTEDGKIILKTMVDGTARSRIEIDHTDVVINQDSIDSNFRVESNNQAGMLFVDAGNDRVGIGTVSPSVLLDLESTAPVIRFTDSDATGTPECEVSGAGGDITIRADRDNEKSSSIIGFEVDGSEKMRILSTGGITFNGDTATANALDDYEEGNFTPVLDFGGGTTGIAYNTQIGRYTKIGRLVQVNITIYLSSKGSSTGVAKITGLPFATGGTQFTAHSYDDRVSGGAVKIQLYNNGNSTQLQLFEADDDQVNNSQIQQDSFSNTAFLIISMQYYVD